jgi:hypothetical protein
MPSTPKLNETQLAVLRWIADGSPAGVMEGHGHRVSAAALRSRGLIRISGRGRTWRARITAAGEVALGIPPHESEGMAVRRRVAAPRGNVAAHARGRPSERLMLPLDLRGAHPLVAATRDAAAGVRPDADGQLRIGPRRGIANMHVSRSVLRRALLILHGLTSAALMRGMGGRCVPRGW